MEPTLKSGQILRLQFEGELDKTDLMIKRFQVALSDGVKEGWAAQIGSLRQTC